MKSIRLLEWYLELLANLFELRETDRVPDISVHTSE
jgi:hypothetical protein